MKAKIIIYGWAFSWLFLFAGLGTIEHNLPVGLLLCSVWLFFSYLLIATRQNASVRQTASRNGWFGCLAAATRINNRFRSQ